MTWTRLAKAIWHVVVPFGAGATPPTPALTTEHPSSGGAEQTIMRPPQLAHLKHRNASMSPTLRVQSWNVQTPTHSSFGPSDLAGPRSPVSSPCQPARQRNKRKHDSHQDDGSESTRKRARTAKHDIQTVDIQMSAGLAGLDPEELNYLTGGSSLGHSPLDSEYSPSVCSEIRLASKSPHSRRLRARKTTQDYSDEVIALPEEQHSFYTYTSTEASLRETSEADKESAPVSARKTPVVTSSVRAPSPSPRTRNAGQVTFDASAFPVRAQPFITHLLSRGYEPILPAHWAMDFKFLPTSLFCRGDERPLVTAVSSTDFRAQRAFSEVLSFASRARDLRVAKREPEGPACRSIQAYLSWAVKDVGLSPDVPDLVVFNHGDRRMDPTVLQRDAAWKLLMQRDRWAAYLGAEDVPPLYGVVVSGMALAVVCWAPSEGVLETVDLDDEEDRISVAEAELKLVGLFDLGVSGLDVWNALAMVLLAMHAREEMRAYA